MASNDSDPRFLGVGLLVGALMMALFLALGAMLGLRSGFYGVPPNGTWYHPAPGAQAPPPPPPAHH